MSTTGAMVTAFFAALWWVLGMWASGQTSVYLYLLPLLISASVVLLALRVRAKADVSPQELARRKRLIIAATAAEGILLFVAVNALVNTGLGKFVAPAGAIIVGLHFLPLARWLPAPTYYVTGILLVMLGVAGCAIPGTGPGALFVCLGSACVLWLTSAAVLRKAR
jgi:hypothetical protein